MTVQDVLIEQMQFTRSFTLRRIETFPPEGHFVRLPNGGNHFIWLVGHLIWSEDALFLCCCGGKSLLPVEMSGLFAYGARLREDTSDYPEFTDLLSMMATVHEGMIDSLRRMQYQELLGDPNPDTHPAFKEMFPTKLDALIHSVRHEWYHVGQISVLARILKESLRGESD